jgi:hypothetical protein
VWFGVSGLNRHLWVMRKLFSGEAAFLPSPMGKVAFLLAKMTDEVKN